MSQSAGDRIEEFRFPSKRDTRAADLLAEGRVRAPANGQALVPGQFREFERLGKYFLRIAGGKFSPSFVPTTGVQKDEPRRVVPTTGVQKAPADPSPPAPPAKWQSEAAIRQRAAAREARWSKHREAIQAKAALVLELLAAGESVTSVIKETGVSRAAIKRLAGGKLFLCPCGRDAAHRGACSTRYEVTPARLVAQQKARERTMSPEGRRQARERATAMQARYTPEERSARTKAMHAARGEARRRETGAKSATERVRRQREQKRRAAAGIAAENRMECRLDGGGVLRISTSTINPAKLTARDRKLLIDLAVLAERFNFPTRPLARFIRPRRQPQRRDGSGREDEMRQ